LTVPEANLHQLPDAVSDDQAVFVEPLAAAYQVIKQVKIEPRMQVTVLGAGRLGLLIAQVLRTTGCRLQVVARSEKSLHFLDRKGIQSISVDQVAPKLDQDVVVEASGSADGFNLATKLVRPRGTLVLKSTYAGPAQLDMAPIVVNEVTVLGSRCGPFTDAIQALARQEIDVESLISRRLPLDRGIEAMQLAADSANIKVLLRMDS
jgi:threonine dehydrogenase-like Zn-dependent dehydrogenase